MKCFLALIALSLSLLQNATAQTQNNPLRKWPLDIRGGYAMFVEDFVAKPGVKRLTVHSSLVTDEAKNVFDHRSITEYQFNEKGALILQRTIKPGTYDDESQPTRYYYKNELLDSVSGGSFNAKFHYNGQAALQHIQFYTTKQTGEQEATLKQIYLYDAQEKLKEIKYFDGQMYSHRQYLLYDKDGKYYGYKLVNDDTSYYTNKTLAFDRTESTSKTVDASGKIKFFSRTVFQYDSFKNVLVVNTFDSSGKIGHYQKMEHQLDKNGNAVSTLTYTNGKLNRNEKRNIIYYDYNKSSTQYNIYTTDSLKIREQPDEVLRHFFTALNNRDYKKAHSYCVGTRWGTAEYFASEKSYGGITAVQIKSIGNIDRSYGNTAKVVTRTQITDPVNGSGEFEQRFILEIQANEHWKIAKTELIASNRPQDNWNLQLTAQNWISFDAVDAYLAKVYDTIPNDPQTDSTEDTLERSLQPLHFFKADSKEYAVAIVEVRGPFYGASLGHCDVFLFTKTDKNKWALSDQLLEAGGGGMYGNPGEFESILRIGIHSAGIVLSGGQTHMGAFFHNDIIEVKNGKMKHMLNIGIHHSYGNWEGHDGYKVCEDLNYKFLKSNQDLYDLQLKVTDCLEGSKKKEKSITIPAKDGKYTIPEGYIFSS
jgi:hypothetical protein